ncbi:hypothetical protein [Candidatus Entotheonella palauensis]|uniref:Uncharacterized protein n=1 Tax=Candidatus Entotheonella gemina TaxID=1429439 RepID=W4M8G1_9BACT|nr:hypothetical protein [Candidatus Entotheonella palauensis]ETX05912.1 MAG: hypothetical protein ETSY2_20235 [Candidatus Entotheonella gemina]
MDRATLVQKMAWQLQPSWHFRGAADAEEWSVKDTVKALQTLLLADGGAFLQQTLSLVAQRTVHLDTLEQLVITLFQEGAVQRVWRAQSTLSDGTVYTFGIIAARAPGTSHVITQNDFRYLQQLHACQSQYCVQPYADGTPAAGIAAFSVEWLDSHKELVFEVVRGGGVFFVNASGHHRLFSPGMSRRIWRRVISMLWSYPGLCGVNIQAGDFIGQFQDHPEDAGDFNLKLTTARDIRPNPEPITQIQDLLGYGITASGYLSDGHTPFDREMQEAVFMPRMQAILQRRFRDRAHSLAQHQWTLFKQGAFARQEDWLRDDYILATYDHLHAELAAEPAWRETRQRWLAYAEAVQSGAAAPSWWFPAPDIPRVLDRLTRHHNFA